MKVLDAEKPWAEPFDPRLFHVKTGNSVNAARRGKRAAQPFIGLLFSHQVGRGVAAGRDDLGNRVAAQTVAAVEAAGDFARRIEAGDHGTVFRKRLILHVDLDAAHRHRPRHRRHAG